jgi:hypothetical protein
MDVVAGMVEIYALVRRLRLGARYCLCLLASVDPLDHVDD